MCRDPLIVERQVTYLVGENTLIDPGAVVGYGFSPGMEPARIGAYGHIRHGTIIYPGVTAGDRLQTGHYAMIRENTVLGDHVVVGTNTVIDGATTIGDFVKIESACYIPTHVTIGTRVFLGPGVILTNDRYPLRQRDTYRPEGPILEDNVTLGGGAVVCPGIRIGAGSFIAAGAIVTKDVPPKSLVVGHGRIEPLPPQLNEPNLALSWRRYLDD